LFYGGATSLSCLLYSCLIYIACFQFSHSLNP
jgi:hypothetical protein